MFPQTPSGIPLPANIPMPTRKLVDQRPPSVNQFNNQQNSEAEAATLAAMAMFQQQQNGAFSIGQTFSANGNGTTTMTQQTTDNR